MTNVGLKEIHIGEAIKKVFDESKMNKSEFGRLIGVQQQHVNRIFERETIETKKLVAICKALNFNFFALFCELPTQINAHLSAVVNGPGQAFYGCDQAIVMENQVLQAKYDALLSTDNSLKEQIDLLKETNAMYKARIEELKDSNNA